MKLRQRFLLTAVLGVIPSMSIWQIAKGILSVVTSDSISWLPDDVVSDSFSFHLHFDGFQYNQ